MVVLDWSCRQHPSDRRTPPRAVPTGALQELIRTADEHGNPTTAEIADILDVDELPVEAEKHGPSVIVADFGSSTGLSEGSLDFIYGCRSPFTVSWSRRSILVTMGCGIAGCNNTSRSTPQSTASEQTTQTRSPNPTDTSAATHTPHETETVTETETPAQTATTEPPQGIESAVVYIPFAGDKFGKCTEVCHPEVGQYSDPIPPDVSSQHAEWLENAGVSTVMFNFGESKTDYERLSTFLRSDLRSMSVEPFYVISQAIRRKRDLEADFAFLRENLLSTSSAKTINGKPVVTFWDFDFLAWGGNEASQRAVELVEEYGGPEGFVDYLREQLTVNGTEPILIGDFFDNAIGGYPDNYAELNKQLDGATNWINAFGESGQVTWEYARNHVAQNFAATRAFCDQHDMRYYPMVYPGFDDRHNSCWGRDRHIPRGPDHLRDLFELAGKYTTGRVNVATFNDWTEGHQIEPGRFRDTDYGMEYLDVVREFSVTK